MSEKFDDSLWDDLDDRELDKSTVRYWRADSDTPLGAGLYVLVGRIAGYDRWLARSVGRRDVCGPQEVICESEEAAVEAAERFMAETRRYAREDFRAL